MKQKRSAQAEFLKWFEPLLYRATRKLATVIIAPTIVLLLPGYILLKIEYSEFNNYSSNEVEAPIAEKAKGDFNQIESVDKIHSLEVDSTEIQTLFETAKKISLLSERDAEFIRIIQFALNKHKPMFAFEVAQSLSILSNRNEQYIKIIDVSIKDKQYAFAKEVAEKISFLSERDVQFKKIINARIHDSINPQTDIMADKSESPKKKINKADIEKSDKNLIKKVIGKPASKGFADASNFNSSTLLEATWVDSGASVSLLSDQIKIKIRDYFYHNILFEPPVIVNHFEEFPESAIPDWSCDNSIAHIDINIPDSKKIRACLNIGDKTLFTYKGKGYWINLLDARYISEILREMPISDDKNMRPQFMISVVTAQ